MEFHSCRYHTHVPLSCVSVDTPAIDRAQLHAVYRNVTPLLSGVDGEGTFVFLNISGEGVTIPATRWWIVCPQEVMWHRSAGGTHIPSHAGGGMWVASCLENGRSQYGTW